MVECDRRETVKTWVKVDRTREETIRLCFGNPSQYLEGILKDKLIIHFVLLFRDLKVAYLANMSGMTVREDWVLICECPVLSHKYITGSFVYAMKPIIFQVVVLRY